MTNSTNDTVRYEYYLDYFDLPPVDASKLTAHRYSIVIGFWIGLVSFVAFLFFILFYMSRSGTTSMKTGGSKKFPWNYSETIHQNLVNNDTVRISVDNQGEEIERLCSSNRLPCHHTDNSV
ncbi:Melanocortin-2 receptor accessory protein [Ophiophagus hannah]|uniref:Melanocortin-2 receptor accessory protein n=1 Tax=Ophiophagus hannah TaxID=8665 RepID=V8PHY4_OPHHA|nr:Melanocortin-2 receptor accessory protein [Ophiophagus hannah]